MSSTIHAPNWKAPDMVTEAGVKTVCNLRRDIESIAKKPGEVTCNVCSLRTLNEGKRLSLRAEKVLSWTWEQLRAGRWLRWLAEQRKPQGVEAERPCEHTMDEHIGPARSCPHITQIERNTWAHVGVKP
jgi:hypothetical protein